MPATLDDILAAVEGFRAAKVALDGMRVRLTAAQQEIAFVQGQVPSLQAAAASAAANLKAVIQAP